MKKIIEVEYDIKLSDVLEFIKNLKSIEISHNMDSFDRKIVEKENLQKIHNIKDIEKELNEIKKSIFYI